MKTSTQISSVPFDNIANQSIIQNLKGVDSNYNLSRSKKIFYKFV